MTLLVLGRQDRHIRNFVSDTVWLVKLLIPNLFVSSRLSLYLHKHVIISLIEFDSAVYVVMLSLRAGVWGRSGSAPGQTAIFIVPAKGFDTYLLIQFTRVPSLSIGNLSTIIQGLSVNHLNFFIVGGFGVFFIYSWWFSVRLLFTNLFLHYNKTFFRSCESNKGYTCNLFPVLRSYHSTFNIDLNFIKIGKVIRSVVCVVVPNL